jgi:hypothetical protein
MRHFIDNIEDNDDSQKGKKIIRLKSWFQLERNSWSIFWFLYHSNNCSSIFSSEIIKILFGQTIFLIKV